MFFHLHRNTSVWLLAINFSIFTNVQKVEKVSIFSDWFTADEKAVIQKFFDLKLCKEFWYWNWKFIVVIFLEDKNVTKKILISNLYTRQLVNSDILNFFMVWRRQAEVRGFIFLDPMS